MNPKSSAMQPFIGAYIRAARSPRAVSERRVRTDMNGVFRGRWDGWEVKSFSLIVALLSLLSFNISCGSKPLFSDASELFAGNGKVFLKNLNDINSASGLERIIDINDLDLDGYAGLVKFTNLHEVTYQFSGKYSANERSLCVLSELPGFSFKSIVLNGAISVDDQALTCLIKISGLRLFGLESTSVTDTGITRLCDAIDPKAVNVSHCKHVAAIGLHALLAEPKLQELCFSTEALTSNDVDQLYLKISESRRLKYCSIDDVGQKLKAISGVSSNGCAITVFSR